MSERVEVPRLEDLAGLPVEVRPGDEPWILAVTALAADGDEVTFTWDEVAAAVHVRWTSQGIDRLVLEREALVRVAMHHSGDCVEFRTWLRSEDIEACLSVRVGKSVTVSDTLLRA